MQNEPKLFKSLKLELEPGIYYWCSCPDNFELVLCESTHNDCAPLKFEITEKKASLLLHLQANQNTTILRQLA